MKNILIILIISLPFIQGAQCKKNQVYLNDFVKLKSVLNNSQETISYGDTLKIKLTIPDLLVTENGTNISVNTLQQGYYIFTVYRIDTTLMNTIVSINNPTNIFITGGGYKPVGENAVYVSSNNKPFTATLNILAPQKGIYYVQIEPSPGRLGVNNLDDLGLKVNFDVADKHWYLYETYSPGFTASASMLDSQGYGWYCFRVN